MSRLLLPTVKALALGACVLTPCLSYAAGSVDYYSHNVEDAVQAAKQNPTNTNTIGKRWYGRSTMRSISFAPLLNAELDTELITNDINLAAIEPVEPEVSQNSTVGTALGRDEKHYMIDDQKRDQLPNQADAGPTPQVIFFRPNDSYTSKTDFGHSEVIHVHGSTLSTSYYRD